MGKAWFGGGKANLCRAGLWQSIGWHRRCIAGRCKGGASKGTALLWRGKDTACVAADLNSRAKACAAMRWQSEALQGKAKESKRSAEICDGNAKKRAVMAPLCQGTETQRVAMAKHKNMEVFNENINQ